MKLYYSPGACSMADHIALHEAELAFDHERVDLKSKTTEHGEDFRAVNPRGYVPALRLDSGETITENLAILSWIAEQAPRLSPGGPLGRTRLLEALAFISTELHKGFKPFFAGADDEAKAKAGQQITKRLEQLADMSQGPYLFGDQPSVADAYLFVMLTWAKKNGVTIPEAMLDLYSRMKERPAVQTAARHEGVELPA